MNNQAEPSQTQPTVTTPVTTPAPKTPKLPRDGDSDGEVGE